MTSISGASAEGKAARIRARGYTIVELLMALVLGSLVLAGLGGVTRMTLTTYDVVSERNELRRQARFAMDQMTRTVGHSRALLLPMNDKPASNWPENIREQTIPASAPIGDSSFATAVLAVKLPESQDLNGDGYPDADDDRDGQVDEDLPNDMQYDFAPGIYQIDDDGDGSVDENFSTNWDDDETNAVFNEDPIDGVDNDGDHNVDEDPASDNNGDGCPGLCGVDDDGDGQIDEGSPDDDDEDGGEYDDWYNPVVFHLVGDALIQRTPVPWDKSGGGLVGGQDFVESPIAEHVTRFRVERIPAIWGDPQLVDLTLELTDPDSGESVSLEARVRLGGAL